MAPQAIQLIHVNFKYSDADRWALNDLSMTVPRGIWLSLIGPNGSGKSTLIKIIDRLLIPQAGQVRINGHVLSQTNVRRLRSRIGIVFQNPASQFVGATVRDDLLFGLENYRVTPDQFNHRIKTALSVVGLDYDFQSRLLNSLSGGQKQRVALADVLVLRPKVLILDEFTSMLDPASRNSILNLVFQLQHRLRLTVIHVTHDLAETQIADRVAVIDTGKLILTGSPKDVFQHFKLMRRLHLALPDNYRLLLALAKRGWPVPGNDLSETKVVEWLKKLLPKI